MGRYKKGKPEGATEIKTYAEFEELISNFAQGKIGLLAIVGNPGLSKSQSIKRALEGEQKRRKPSGERKAGSQPRKRKPKSVDSKRKSTEPRATIADKTKRKSSKPKRRPCLYIKGRKSAIDLYCDLYTHQGEPVVADDCDDLMTSKATLGIMKDLCETDHEKQLGWGTSTNILDKRGIPKQFTTTSHVCIISNHWGSDVIYKALESRGEFVYFNPTWGELYRQVSEWFWDQEIFDYVHSKMEFLKQPDARLFVKAAARKVAGMEKMHWTKLIDDYCDDKAGMVIRKIMGDPSFPNEAAREDYFAKETGLDRTTYYRRKKEIQSHQPAKKPARIVLKNTTPQSG